MSRSGTCTTSASRALAPSGCGLLWIARRSILAGPVGSCAFLPWSCVAASVFATNDIGGRGLRRCDRTSAHGRQQFREHRRGRWRANGEPSLSGAFEVNEAFISTLKRRGRSQSFAAITTLKRRWRKRGVVQTLALPSVNPVDRSGDTFVSAIARVTRDASKEKLEPMRQAESRELSRLSACC
jgi:hypothetical protein